MNIKMMNKYAWQLAPCLWCTILTSLAMVAAGCSHKEADIYRNPDVAIRPTASYALSPTLRARPEEFDPRVHNALVHERIRSAITAALGAKGYRQSPPESAEFLVRYRVEVRTGERDVGGLVWRHQPAGPSGEGPKPILTVTRAGMTEMTEGDLVIEVVERQTGAVVYRAEGHDDAVTPWDASELMISSVVRVLLQEL